MRKLIISVLFALSALLVPVPAVLALTAADDIFGDNQELIRSFDVAADLSADRNLTVTETIIYDFSGFERHGIYRYIPQTYNRNGMKYKLRLEILEVLRDGQAEPYTETRDGDDIKLKIGRAEATITGTHTYVIKYSTDKAINFFPDHSELYWNVTGNGWVVDILRSSFTLHTPAGAKHENFDFTCFTGMLGQTLQDCDSTPGLPWLVKSTRVLEPGEGMTVVFGFPSGVITPPTTAEIIMGIVADNWTLVIPFFVFIYMLWRWKKYGKDPAAVTIIPQYESPRGLLPLPLSGALGAGSIPPQGITATIIDMARKGRLHIKYGTEKHLFGDKTTYTFIRKNPPTGTAAEWETSIWNGLFNYGKREESTFEDLKKDKFYANVQKANSQGTKFLSSLHIFDASPYGVIATYAVIGLAAGFVVNIIGSTLASFLAGFLTAVIIIGFGIFMPRRTLEGTKIVAEVKGFKWFLGVTEEERLKFHNAPSRTPEEFMELLPAAIALGVEKQWADQFKDIQLQPPEWAEGNFNSLTSLAMVSAISDMGHATSASVYSPPSSTAGGGGSGFSGGGSGGGFGGGGGGSW